jgi:hypothetical protein
VSALSARSFLIDGEAICTDENGLAVFDLIRHKRPRRTKLPCQIFASKAGDSARSLILIKLLGTQELDQDQSARDNLMQIDQRPCQPAIVHF